MAEISLRKLNKIYDNKVHAVHDLSLEIPDGEFVVLVGPSGCGKSTLLRMIAGLEEISFGKLYMDGKLMNEVPPKDRKIAMVFQNYALFPHMTVYENIAFGLKLAKINRDEIKKRVEEAAKILGIETLLTRKPAQLSGGQKQRVALGRAIVCKPDLFLLDEPLSNLDAKLRASMRSELIKLHDKLQTTFIYVTHDQTEALTMGTKIAVLKDGYLQQAATPTQIYDHPQNTFVATFMGSPQINLFDVMLEGGEKLSLRFQSGDKLILPDEVSCRLNDRTCIGRRVTLGIRPEHLYLSPEGELFATADITETLGNSAILNLNAEGALNPTTALLGGREKYPEAGERVRLKIDVNRVHLFDAETGKALLTAPDENLFAHAAVTLDEGALKVMFADTSFLLDKYDCLLDDSVLTGKPVTVGLPVKEPTDTDDAFGVKARITHISQESSRLVVYAALNGTQEKLIFVCPTDAQYAEGEERIFCFAKSDVRLYDEAGNSLLSKYPTRERFCRLAEKRERGQTLRILADEWLGDRYLLYCGTDDENYCAVYAEKEFPVYFRENVKVYKESE